jgi:hypothetical protein
MTIIKSLLYDPFSLFFHVRRKMRIDLGYGGPVACEYKFVECVLPEGEPDYFHRQNFIRGKFLFAEFLFTSHVVSAKGVHKGPVKFTSDDEHIQEIFQALRDDSK